MTTGALTSPLHSSNRPFLFSISILNSSRLLPNCTRPDPFGSAQSAMVVAMDALALNLKTGCLSPVAGRKPRPTAAWRLSARIGGQSTEKTRKARSLSLTVVCASGKKKSNGPPFSENDEPLVPGGDGREEPKTPHEKSEPHESKSYHVVSDWRDFRANLVAREKDILQKSEQQPESGTKPTGITKGGKESSLWAHQTIPEVGCLLIATEEIDRDDNFQRSVVLLVSLGSRYPHEGHGPVGLILNRPLDRKVKDTETMHPGLASNFGNHQLHFGGPLQSLDVSMFLVKTGGGVIGIAHESGLQQVVSGVHFGGVKRIEEAAALVRGGVLEPSDFKFFAGYACWGYDQLMREIEMGYWVVAACSSDVIGRAITGSSDQMWQEVLQIMGGQYADLSKKAKLDEPMQD